MSHGEIWRVIPAWPQYEASSLGRIRRAAPGCNTFVGRVRTCYLRDDGYLMVQFRRPGTRRTVTKHVNWLVCEAFHAAPPTDQHEAAHWDGSRDNNRADNLRWATPKEQIEDMRRHGRTTALVGEKNHRAILTEEAVRIIRATPRKYGYKIQLARRFGVSPITIGFVVRGKSWATVR